MPFSRRMWYCTTDPNTQASAHTQQAGQDSFGQHARKARRVWAAGQHARPHATTPRSASQPGAVADTRTHTSCADRIFLQVLSGVDLSRFSDC